ncbi:MAG: GGDEF and EAL domain-containing protein [Proteobacteria bacterium]|nr:GGDEF and EAL domain-containing protein [Pseudomonadota bacterium]MBI3496143.1 GGDEF and EAL domain-containing protein [Pseudomonadota bacterium]
MPTSETAREHLDRAVTAAGDLAYEWDFETGTFRWFGLPESVLGARTARLIASAKGLVEAIHPEDRERRGLALDAHFHEASPYACDYRVATAAGGFVWMSDRGAAEFDAEGRPIRMFGALRQIDAYKRNEAHLKRLAEYDELSGHRNRTELRRMLEDEIAQGQLRAGVYLAVGIDTLRTVNELFGAPSADAVIRIVGERLAHAVGAAGIIGRVDGDTFGVILAGLGPEVARETAQRLLRAVDSSVIETPAGDLRVTVSIGLVDVPETTRSAADAMVKAEAALADAKRAGRNCWLAYRRTERERRSMRVNLAIAELIERGVRQSRIHMAYQPVVATVGRRICHYESLLRMRDDVGEMINAGSLIPVAEALGLMHQLDRVVLESVLNTLAGHPGVSLAVNVSGLNAGQGTWLTMLHERLRQHPDIARRLIVEITETVALVDVDETQRFVSAVHALGGKVALDDFGAGYTSFRHLRQLGVDFVKIDGSFVRGIASEPDNRLFIRMLAGLANGFGLITVAESVESEADAAVLAEEGIHQLQGYLFGRPRLGEPWLEAAG